MFFALLVSVVCLCGSLLLNFSLLTKYGKLSEEVERQGHLIEKVVGDQMSNIALQTQVCIRILITGANLGGVPKGP